MGVGVSNWRLANAVSKLGQLGVVSGTALDQLFVRRLADGDKGGDMRRGLDAFPFLKWPSASGRSTSFPAASQRNGLPDCGDASKAGPAQARGAVRGQQLRRGLSGQGRPQESRRHQFSRKGCSSPICLPFTAPCWPGLGYVLMGAGIPLHIPGVLDSFAAHQPRVQAVGRWRAAGDGLADVPQSGRPCRGRTARPSSAQVPGHCFFQHLGHHHAAPRQRPRRRTDSRNAHRRRAQCAPARQAPALCVRQPVYGERDAVNIAGLRALGVPFWLAGGYGSPEKVREALDQGAAGVQVGTAFAFTEESGPGHRSEENAIGPSCCRRWRGVYGSAGVAHRISLQSRPVGRFVFRCGSDGEANQGLRPGLSA